MVATRAVGRSVAVTIVALSALVPFTSTAAGATATFAPTLGHQDPVVVLTRQSVGTFSLTLDSASADHVSGANLTLYPAVHTVSALAPIVSGLGDSSLPITSTGRFGVDCAGIPTTTFSVTVTAHGGAPIGKATCTGAKPALDLGCSHFSCAGVYPLEIATTNGVATTMIWSLLAVSTGTVGLPVRLAQFFLSDPTTAALTRTEASSLAVIASAPKLTAGIALSYPGISQAYFATTAAAATYRRELLAALASKSHTLFNAPPASTDFAALAGEKLANDLSDQLHLATQLADHLGAKRASQWQVLTGALSAADVAALANDHVHDVVVPDSDLTTAPSSTLVWGEPSRLAGVPSGLLAVTTNTPLETLAQDRAISPGLRAALTLGEIALLYYEAPYADVARTLVLVTSLSADGPSYLHDLLAGLSHDPLIDTAAMAELFRPSAVGGNGDPTQWTLRNVTDSSFSGDNVRSVRSLDSELNALSQSVLSSLAPATPLRVQVLAAEKDQSASARQTVLDTVRTRLDGDLAEIHIDDTTINLAGAATSLPITLTSRAPYKVTGYLVLSAPGVKFPNGSVVGITVSNSTDEFRVPADIDGPSSFTLVVQFKSLNGSLVIANAAITVHSTATSVVGYVITVLALAVIALWWLRTARKRPRAKHAR